MNEESPRRWLERLLLVFLNERDRETISGDLLEEYREAQRPRLGLLRADIWYLCQAMSLALNRISGGPFKLKPLLTLLSVFSIAAGTWLSVMENILKHPGYAGRAVIGGFIAAQGLATLLVMLLNGRPMYRALVFFGALGILCLGVSASVRNLRAAHFEGFVLIIGAALILQAILTLAVFLRSQRGKLA